MVNLVDTGQHTMHVRLRNANTTSIESLAKRIMSMGNEAMSIEIRPSGGSGETRIMRMGNEVMSIETHPPGGSGWKRIMSMEETMSIEIHPQRGSAKIIVRTINLVSARHVVTILLNAPSRDRIGPPLNGLIKLLCLMA